MEELREVLSDDSRGLEQIKRLVRSLAGSRVRMHRSFWGRLGTESFSFG